MVEQMGVEPTTYTMRTYRSSQLSYCPTKNVLVNIHRKRENSRGGAAFFSEKGLETIIPVPGFHGETCTANLYRSQNNAFLPEKSDGSRFFHVEADVEWSYIESRDRIPARVSVSLVLSLA